MQNLQNGQSIAEDRELPPEEMLQKLKSPESLKDKEENQKFIANYKWKKGRVLGSGGQAIVYLMEGSVTSLGGLRKTTKAYCAMKIFNPQQENTITMIKQACEVLTLLKHKNVMQYYDFNVVEKHFMHIYMELMQVIIIH